MNRVPRVLLLCDRLDIAGGVERFVCTLAAHLAGQGFDVAVGSVATRRAEIRYPLPAVVRVLHDEAGWPEGRGAIGLLRKQWRTGRALSSITRRDAPDVVVLNGLTTACSVLALDRHAVARTICCDHNHFAARSRFWQVLRALLYRRAAAVVSLTQADAAAFSAINARTRVIANASSLRGDAREAADRAATAPPLVLAVARHVAQKGLDLLLQAWVSVRERRAHAVLRIVGDGPLTATLRSQAREAGIDGSVEWCAPTDDVSRHYRDAAVFVLPSRYEGMPLALLEAQALGVPAVAFDCPTGPRDIVDEASGCLVPPGDVKALADAVVALLDDAPRRVRMAAAAVARSESHFSPAQHFAGWTSLVARVAEGAPA